jgi:plasmid stability protein
MALNLSIKNVPDEVVKCLRQRAARHHRSLQGELMAIVEESVRSEDRLAPEDLLREVERLGLRTPAEAAKMIRADRNARKGR